MPAPPTDPVPDDAAAPRAPGDRSARPVPDEPAPPAADERAPGADLFDALYPALLAPFHPEQEARREVAALREMLGLSLSDRVLDLGCGWGRHLALLHEAGHPVIGLDLSPALLGMAREAGATRLVAGDMRRLPMAEGTFDVVLNLATSLGLFLGDAGAVAALEEVRRVLRPGGRLLVEGMHRDDVVSAFSPRARWTLPDGTRVRARRRFDAVRGISHEELRWDGPLGRGEKRHALRIRTATELTALVRRAGLEVREVWGGWDGERFRHDSERLVLRAERPAGPSRVAASPS